MKKLALVASLVLGLSACSSGITNINQVNLNNPVLNAVMESSIISEYCTQNFSNKGKEAIFKQQYEKSNQINSNYLNLTILSLEGGNDLWKLLQLKQKATIYARAQKMANNTTTGQAMNAFNADPNGEAIVKRFFNKSYCIKELEVVNQFRHKMNSAFISNGRNDLVVE